MTLKCKECGTKLIFKGGVKQGKIDIEIHECYRCNKLYSFDYLKGSLKEYKEKIDFKK